MTTRRSTWRDTYKVHPAADVFPMMSDDELAKLGEDIKANGLKQPIMLWSPGKLEDLRGTGVMPDTYLLDGRNRLEATERAGMSISDGVMRTLFADIDPVAFVISANIRRRHLTKQQQADLIVAAHRASRQLGEVPKRHAKGKAGSGKDTVKAAAMKDAEKHGIGKRTVERSFAKAEGKPQKPKASPEEIAAKRKATLEANRKARTEEAIERGGAWGEFLGRTRPQADPASWQRLAKVLVRLGSEHEGERHAAADAANKILQPIGWQLVRHGASTLPQGDIPAYLDRRRPS